MKAFRCIFALISAWLLCSFVLMAQGPVRVSMLTADAGAEVYQLEGHAALRLERPGSYDVVVNWGVFDFNSPNFLYRFVKGETDYIAAAYPYALFESEYRQEGRGLVEQELALDSATVARLEALVMENLLPERRTYRYNYVADNCATRPLALMERALGDTLRLLPLAQTFRYGETQAIDKPDGEHTFRSEMTRYHSHYPWYQFGIDLALGSGIDHHISHRQRTFSPLYLRQALETAQLPDGSPLVSATNQILPENIDGVCLKATPWFLTPLAAGWLLLILAIGLSLYNIACGRINFLGRLFDCLLYTAIFLAGLLLTFLIFVSVHPATSPNWLYLWLNPLAIVAAVGIWLKSWKRAVYWYQICNFALLIALLVGHRWLGQALNQAFPLFILADLVRSFTFLYVNRKA